MSFDSSCPKDIGARASIHMCPIFCLISCSRLFGIVHVIQDFCIRSTEFLVQEACQMSHIG